MNKVILCGRLTRDPEVRYSTSTGSGEALAIARFTIAVPRKSKSSETDFISCVAMGRQGEFAEKYLRQGMKMLVCGHIQTGSYTNKDGQKIYTTDVYVDEFEFAEGKSESSSTTAPEPTPEDGGAFIPTGDDDLPPFMQ